jgi:hypothetical protein
MKKHFITFLVLTLTVFAFDDAYLESVEASNE